MSPLIDEFAGLDTDLVVGSEEWSPESAPCVAETEFARSGMTCRGNGEEGELMQRASRGVVPGGKGAESPASVEPFVCDELSDGRVVRSELAPGHALPRDGRDQRAIGVAGESLPGGHGGSLPVQPRRTSEGRDIPQ